ncbi:MAG: hypothetical protein HQK49_02050 [Oligoflexia bacterium]|nr:hypothetical protein [Oligoflexia bacterium]
MKIKRKKNKNNKGQALFEFFLFLPLMLSLYVIIVYIAGSINGSINQQKITRAYLYFTMMGDSDFPSVNTIRIINSEAAVKMIGIFALGWKTEFNNLKPNAACYKLLTLANGETLDIKKTGNTVRTCTPGDSTRKAAYIRVKTAYGVCTSTFVRNGYGGYDHANNSWGSSTADYSACTNSK